MSRFGAHCRNRRWTHVSEESEALHDLVEEWENHASMYGTHQRETFNARCEIYAKCAEELEEVLAGGD